MKQRSCVIICPIGDEGSEVRNDADLLHDFIIKPVLSQQPFNLVIKRADKLGQPGIITNQIIHEIEHADLVVADLSFGNPNVFYEVAIRHVTRKPFVHLVRRGQRIPFDNAPVRAIEFDLSDLRSVDNAKGELASQAQAALDKGISESPVSIAATMDSLKRSGNDEQIALAGVLTELNSLRGALDRVAASQLAIEKRIQRAALPYGIPPASTNSLIGGATGPTTLADFVSSTPENALSGASRNALADAVADYVAGTKKKSAF